MWGLFVPYSCCMYLLTVDIILQRNILCDTSSRIEIECTLNTVGAVPQYFIHTSGSKKIRTLTGTRINNRYTLTIPFCDYQDIGDYTCYWSTEVSGFAIIKKTTTLTVKGIEIENYFRSIFYVLPSLTWPHPMPFFSMYIKSIICIH